MPTVTVVYGTTVYVYAACACVIQSTYINSVISSDYAHFVRLNDRPTWVYHIGDEGGMAAVSVGQLSEFQSELESITMVFHC